MPCGRNVSLWVGGLGGDNKQVFLI